MLKSANVTSSISSFEGGSNIIIPFSRWRSAACGARRTFATTAGGLLVLLAALGFGRPASAAPYIEITDLPNYGASTALKGRAGGVTLSNYRVAVFIYVAGQGWWSKPSCSAQLTVISADGRWSTDITTGGSDPFATRVAALLVPAAYAEPCVQGAPTLPLSALDKAIAKIVLTRSYPGPRWIRFSEYDWWVKTSAVVTGPGPNYFSDSTNNVWVDTQGQLHLKITNRTNRWQCAEVVSARTFGPGHYRFELATTPNNLDPKAVLGLFTWSDDAAYSHREIDLEFSRWGNASDPTIGQYVVQPWDSAGHLKRFSVPVNLTNSTHSFTWESNRVVFLSQRGSYQAAPLPGNLISNWTYTLVVPRSGDENVRFNLWLMNGTPPAGNQEVEFVIRKFQFVPLGNPPSAKVNNLQLFPDGGVALAFTTEPDWFFEVQSSANLAGWRSLATLFATNRSVQFQAKASDVSGDKYFRVRTLP
jgi:hypothetical protein